MAATRPNSGFDVLVVGAGISGLATAIALARSGHRVRVLEQKESLNEFGASIGILPNAVKVLQHWGLEELFAPHVTKNGYLEFRRGTDNHLLGRKSHNVGGTAEIDFGAEYWNTHRVDYQEVLAQAAIREGAEIIFGADTVRVDVAECVVSLADGKRMEADLIVGADGMKSAVRAAIPSTASTTPQEFPEIAYRCTVPKSKMTHNPKVQWLLENRNEMSWLAKERYVLTWPLPPDRPYDVVCAVSRPSDVPAGQWGCKADPAAMQKDFTHFCPEIRELLSLVDRCIKWTIAELPPLETFRSPNGRVVLVGDAAHAMVPHAASGGASAIEDAAVLFECLSWALDHNKDLSAATNAYEKIRKPRVERLQAISRGNYGFLSADGEFAEIRNQRLGQMMAAQDEELSLSQAERRSRPKPTADREAPYPTPALSQWIYAYDAIEHTREFLADLERSSSNL